ncbi:hypothetical protein ACT691_17160 [Vibrio metschnikovii]
MPTSDTLAKSIVQAILNPPRLQLTEINLPLDNGFDFPHLEGNDALPRSIDAESYAAQTWISIPYQHFHASHRLSGWKETNAMYVALNSHSPFCLISFYVTMSQFWFFNSAMPEESYAEKNR